MTINIEFFKFIIAGLVKKEDVILKELSHEHRKFKPFIKPNISEYEKKKNVSSLLSIHDRRKRYYIIR